MSENHGKRRRQRAAFQKSLPIAMPSEGAYGPTVEDGREPKPSIFAEGCVRETERLHREILGDLYGPLEDGLVAVYGAALENLRDHFDETDVASDIAGIERSLHHGYLRLGLRPSVAVRLSRAASRVLLQSVVRSAVESREEERPADAACPFPDEFAALWGRIDQSAPTGFVQPFWTFDGGICRAVLRGGQPGEMEAIVRAFDELPNVRAHHDAASNTIAFRVGPNISRGDLDRLQIAIDSIQNWAGVDDDGAAPSGPLPAPSPATIDWSNAAIDVDDMIDAIWEDGDIERVGDERDPDAGDPETWPREYDAFRYFPTRRAEEGGAS